MNPLAAALIPLIPGLLASVLQIVNTIRDQPDTPEAQKAQLDTISRQLDDVSAQVAAVEF